MTVVSLDAESVAVELGRTGLAIREGYLPCEAVAELLLHARTEHAAGRFCSAAVGGGDTRQIDAAVRGDSTLWMSSADATVTERIYLDAMEELRLAVNSCLQLGAFEIEAHYAMYPPGAAYSRHRDRPRSSNARVVSTVLYLNEDWEERDGGALRLYLEGGVTREVFPRAGVLVAFLSESIEHEVMAATRERWSVAGWLRRR